MLEPTQTSGRCVGCHAVTPDSAFFAASVSSDLKNGASSCTRVTVSNSWAKWAPRVQAVAGKRSQPPATEHKAVENPVWFAACQLE